MLFMKSSKVLVEVSNFIHPTWYNELLASISTVQVLFLLPAKITIFFYISKLLSGLVKYENIQNSPGEALDTYWSNFYSSE